MINAEQFVKTFGNKHPVQPFRLGKVPDDYISGRPQIIFDGETVLSTKQYPYLSGYSPAAGDRVLMACVGGTYVILGKII